LTKILVGSSSFDGEETEGEGSVEEVREGRVVEVEEVVEDIEEEEEREDTGK
jgi:hypothetical protein